MKKTKRILLYDPYLDTMGGGEKHILSILKVLDNYGYAIEIIWNDPGIALKIKLDLDLHFNNLTIVKNFLVKDNFLNKTLKTRLYDMLFYISDGSYFLSLAKRNYIFAMVPQLGLFKKSLANKIKFANFSFITNSKFTQERLRQFNIESEVIYPFIQKKYFISNSDLKNKKKIIIAVGRFFNNLHNKKHDKIIEMFKSIKHRDNLFKDFKLYLVGRAKDEDKIYLEKINNLATGREDIHIRENLDESELLKLYKKAMFFWHLTGYGVNENQNPERVEHLGIAPLEAMAAGAIPLAYLAGGIRETIADMETGASFIDEDELFRKMYKINIDQELRSTIIKNGINFVKSSFSDKAFNDRVKNYFNL